MRIQCDKCKASYNVPDGKVKGRAFRVTCKRCQNVIHVRPTKPDEGGRKTMELQAVDVQPRMTGEMRAMDPDELAKTTLAPQKQPELRQEAKAEEKPAEKAAPKPEEPKQEEPKKEEPKPVEQKPRLTIEGQALPEQPVKKKAAWYLAYSKNKRGPMSVEDISRHLAGVAVTGEVYIWKSGFDNWKKLQDVPEFAEVVKQLEAQKGDTTQKIEQVAEEPVLEDNTTRPTFTDLIKAELGDTKKAESAATQKIDLSELKKNEAVQTQPAFTMKPGQIADAKSGEVKIEEYVPLVKKKIPIVPIVILSVLFALVVGTPLTLAYKHIIEIPGLDRAPVIGTYFKKEEIDYYAKLREQWEMLIRIDEAKIAFQATKEEEERQRIEDEKRKAEEEKKLRMARAKQYRKRISKRSGRSKSNVFEFDFSNGMDGTEMETEKDLDTVEIARNKPLTQAEVNKVIKSRMRAIASCVAEYKTMEGRKAKKGQLMVEFTVSRRGSVVRAHATSPKFANTFVADCVVSQLERTKFPKSGGSITASYPFGIR